MVVTARAQVELNLSRQSILPYCPGSNIGAPDDVPSLYTPLARDEQYGIGSWISCFQVDCHCSSPELASKATRFDLCARPQNRAFTSTYRPTPLYDVCIFKDVLLRCVMGGSSLCREDIVDEYTMGHTAFLLRCCFSSSVRRQVSGRESRSGCKFLKLAHTFSSVKAPKMSLTSCPTLSLP
jgi:hypothetical protein